jgi:hypothetical protein
MNSEIMSLKQHSVDIIKSVDYHKNVISECDRLLTSLNRELAEKQAQKDKIDSLEKQIMMLMDMNKQLMSRLGDETSKTENNESLGA